MGATERPPEGGLFVSAAKLMERYNWIAIAMTAAMFAWISIAT
jgi:hypothetical protein